MRGVQHFTPQRFQPRPPFIDPKFRGLRLPGYQPRPIHGIPGQHPPRYPHQRPPNPGYGPPRPARAPFFRQPGPRGEPQQYVEPAAMQFQQGPQYSPSGPVHPDPTETTYERSYETNGHSTQRHFFQEEQEKAAGLGGPHYGQLSNGPFGNIRPVSPELGRPVVSEGMTNSFSNVEGSMFADRSSNCDSLELQGNQMQQLFNAIVTAEHEEQFEAYLNKWRAYYTANREQYRASCDAVNFQPYNRQFQAYLDYIQQYRTALEQRKTVRIAAEMAAVPTAPPYQLSTAPRPPKPEPRFLRTASQQLGSTAAPPAVGRTNQPTAGNSFGNLNPSQMSQTGPQTNQQQMSAMVSEKQLISQQGRDFCGLNPPNQSINRSGISLESGKQQMDQNGRNFGAVNRPNQSINRLGMRPAFGQTIYSSRQPSGPMDQHASSSFAGQQGFLRSVASSRHFSPEDCGFVDHLNGWRNDSCGERPPFNAARDTHSKPDFQDSRIPVERRMDDGDGDDMDIERYEEDDRQVECSSVAIQKEDQSFDKKRQDEQHLKEHLKKLKKFFPPQQTSPVHNAPQLNRLCPAPQEWKFDQNSIGQSAGQKSPDRRDSDRGRSQRDESRIGTGPMFASPDDRLRRNHIPSAERYRDFIDQSAVATPQQLQMTHQNLWMAPPTAVQDGGENNLSAEVVSKLGQARGLMETLSRSGSVSLNELLCIINSVKTESLIDQTISQQQLQQNPPILETELTNLQRQVQAAVQATSRPLVTTPQRSQFPQVGQPTQRLVSQHSQSCPVNALESVSNSLNPSVVKPLFRSVAIPTNTSAAIQGVEFQGEVRPGQSIITLSGGPVTASQTASFSTYAKPSAPLVNSDVMSELGMDEAQVIQAMERLKALFESMVGPDQAAKLASLLQATVSGGLTPANVAAPQRPSQQFYRHSADGLQHFPRDFDHDRELHSSWQRDREPWRRDRTPERHYRSPSPKRPSPQSAPWDLERKSGVQGIFAKALQQRGLPSLPDGSVRGPLVPPGVGPNHRPAAAHHPVHRCFESGSNQPSQEGQPSELLRCSLTPLADLVPRKDRTKKKLAILLRGPPGSGKSWVAKKIKEKDPNVRILSIDDYFEVEREVDEVDAKGRHTSRKAATYQYEERMEGKYRQALEKLFRKKTEDVYCTCLVVDACNEKLSYFMDMVMQGKRNGFEVFIGEMPFMKPYELERRSTHFRSASDIAEIIRNWEPTPSSLFRVDLSTLLTEMPQWMPELPVNESQRISVKLPAWRGLLKTRWEVDDDDQGEVGSTTKNTELVEKRTDSRMAKDVNCSEKSASLLRKTTTNKFDSSMAVSEEHQYRSRSRSPDSTFKKRRNF